MYSDVRKCVESASDQLSVTGSRDSHDITEHLNTAEPLYDSYTEVSTIQWLIYVHSNLSGPTKQSVVERFHY